MEEAKEEDNMSEVTLHLGEPEKLTASRRREIAEHLKDAAKLCMGLCSECAQYRCFFPENHEGRERGDCLCEECHFNPLRGVFFAFPMRESSFNGGVVGPMENVD